MSAAGPVVCICGPTASGKSAVADLLAQMLGTDVISVDSMQVYRGMDIGTAKTPPAERTVPLQMVDVASIGEDYSASRFQAEARALVDVRLAAGETPVLCGGTGLYLDAVIDEMSFPAGETHGSSREPYERLLAEQGAQALWELLRERDAASAEAIHPNNAKRVVRALEMLDEGTSYAAQLAGLHERKPHYEARLWALSRDRAVLYQRIDERVDVMMAQGLVDEVRSLVAQGFGADLTARQAIGYKEILEALAGTITMDEAASLIKQRSRRYAKRQLSWLRRDGRMRWIDIDELGAEGAARQIYAELQQD